jgi:hypothetical protein
MDRPSTVLRLTRRRLLLGAAGAAFLAACGGGDDDASGEDETNSDLRFLVPFFATGENEAAILRTGVEQRMPWGIGDDEGIPLGVDHLPATLDFAIRPEGGTAAVSAAANRHGEGVPTPYFSLRHTFTEPGMYSVTTTFDGQELQRFVQVVPPESITLVQPGERAVPVVTPTTTDARGVDPICTREPPCPFHDITLADALVNGQPTVVLVSTPLFCQTAVCGPVLELLIEQAPESGVDVVHAEVYADALAKGDIFASTPTEAITAYNLTFEPSLLVIDAAGLVVDRLDFLYDASELRATLAKLTG